MSAISNQTEEATTNRPVIDFSGIIACNPTGLIPRDRISEKTGGLIESKYIANLDSKGEGIKDRFRVGRKVVYPVKAVVAFLESRAQIIDSI